MATVMQNASSAEVGLFDPAATFEHKVPAGAGDSSLSPSAHLGFSGYVISGTGEYVLSVNRGSIAQRIGLRPGDVILALNGHRLTCQGAWHRAIARATAVGGKMTLKIRNGQTGHVTQHTSHVFSAP